MAFSSADWTIDYTLKTVTNDDSGTGNNLPSALGTNAKVGPILEFFQWLAQEFAANAQMNDEYAIQSDTPTVFKWLNGWAFGDAEDYKYLTGGSIESSDGNEAWANLYTIGSQTTGTLIALFQDDAEITPWWITGNLDILVHVKTGGSFTQSDNTAGTPTDGGVWCYAREFGDEFDHGFADLSGLGRNPLGINTAVDGNNASGELFLTGQAASGFTAGNFVDNGSGVVGKIQKILGNDVYLNAVRGGVYATGETLTEYSDRELQTATGQSVTNSAGTAFTDVVAGYTNIGFAHINRDFTGGTVASGPFQLGEVVNQVGGAVLKFVTIIGTTLYMENVSGSPTGTGDLTGATSGATYTPTATSVQTSADQDLNNGAGVQPYNFFIGHAARSPAEIYEYGKYITRYGSVTALFTLNGDDGQEYRSANEGTYSEVKKAPYGTLAGTTFYGATGVWMDAYSVADFVLLDANLATQSPPDYQKAVASHDDLDGSVSTLGGVQLFVSEITGSGGTYVTPYTFDQAGSTANTIRANEAIDINKTPQTGTVRIGDTEYAYTGLNTATDDFTGVTPDPTGESNAAAFSVPLISLLADADTEQSDNIIYSTPFWCRIVARRWGTKPYTVDAQFGANGLNFSPILSTDPQAKP